MKKLFLLCIFISTFSYSQVTDEVGRPANGKLGPATLPLSGNIGIGMTPSPSSSFKLEVNGSTKISEGLKVGELNGDGIFEVNTNPITDVHDIRLHGNNGIARAYLAASTSRTQFSLGNINGQEVFNINTGDLGPDNVYIHMPKPDSRIVIAGYGDYLPEHKFVVKDGSAMIEGNILTNNNIGIGTNNFVDGSDTYRLSVNGRVRAHAVKVYTAWADFVFEADYELPTLEVVEAYIQTNGHLKDIPSAKDVEANGIELGEMNKLLLQKIEELTLYVIDLKKEVELLKSKE